MKITGEIQRLGRLAPDGTDGVQVRIYRSRTTGCGQASLELVWDHTVALSDAPCTPGEDATSCGSGHSLDVLNGDRLYFRVSSGEDIVGDLVAWNPRIQYDSLVPCVPELLPGTGSTAMDEGLGQGGNANMPPTCHFATPGHCAVPLAIEDAHWSRTEDFRTADAKIIGWSAHAGGVVMMSGSVTSTAPGAQFTLYGRRSFYVNAVGAEIPPPWNASMRPLDAAAITALTTSPRRATLVRLFTMDLGVGVNNLPAGLGHGVRAGDQVIGAVTLPVGADPAMISATNVRVRYVQVEITNVAGLGGVFAQVGPCVLPPGAVAGDPAVQRMCPVVGVGQVLNLPENTIDRPLGVAVGETEPMLVCPRADTMIGWYRGWSYGELNGDSVAENGLGFDERWLTMPNPLGEEETMLRAFRREILPANRSFPLSPFELSTQVQGPSGDETIAGPGFRGTGLDSYATAQWLKPSSVAKLRVMADGSVRTLEGYASVSGPAVSLRAGNGWEVSGDIGVGYERNVGGGGEMATTANVSGHAGGQIGNSYGDVDFYDFNGDRLPDGVRRADDSPNGAVQIQLPNHRFAPRRPIGLRFESLRHTTSASWRGSVGFGVQPSSVRHWKLSSGVHFNPQPLHGSGGTTFSQSTEDLTVADINGDGLPDHLRIVIAPNSTNNGGGGSPPKDSGASDDLGNGGGGGGGGGGGTPGGGDQIDSGIASGMDSGAGNGGGGNAGSPQPFIEYQLNLGYRLGAVRRIPVGFGRRSEAQRRVDQGFSDSHAETVAVGAGFFVIGGNYSGGTSTTTSQLMDVTGDGLPDHVQAAASVNGHSTWRVSVNLGTSFAAPATWVLGDLPNGGTDGAVTRLGYHSFAASAGLPLQFSFGAISFYVEPGGSLTHQWSDTTLEMEDINGDGLIDQIARDGDGNIFWRKSPVANASNMLRTITSPLGATTTLEFAREGNSARQTVVINGEPTTTYMPHNEWVLSRVRTVESPTRENTPGYFSTTRYDYHRSGNYDPAARESYGFAWVTTIRDDNARTESYFHNQDY